MENALPFDEQTPAELPKPELEETKSISHVWLKSLVSLTLYLVVGYFFFHKNWTLVLILTAVVILHELGHFLAMKYFHYQDLGIFFIPLMGAYVSGKKQEVSQWQSVLILLAGPVPGILAGMILHFMAIYLDIRLLEMTAWILIYLNLLNLLPVYPLDGGQLLHRLFLDDYQVIGKIFVLISALALAWLAVVIGFYPLLFFPVLMISRLIGDIKQERITAKIEAEGINLMKSYEELSAEEYWQIRNAVIRYFPQFKEVPPSPPYQISSREEQLIIAIQNLLQRSILQDMSPAAKLLILLLWLACFLIPIALGMPLRFF